MANKLTQAGDQQNSLLKQRWQLAPLPIPLNESAIAQQLDMETANTTTINYGRSDYLSAEFGVRMAIYGMVFSFFAIFIAHIIVIVAAMNRDGYDFITTWYISWDEIKIGYVMAAIMSLLFITVSIHSLFKKGTESPIRFNREKRQVSCITPQGNTLIADWESVKAIAETKQQVTAYFAIEGGALTLILADRVRDEAVEIIRDYPLESLAIAEWEAIRTYMEEGLESLRQKTDKAEKQTLADALKKLSPNSLEYYQVLCQYYPEGSVDYFYAVKNRVKKEGKIINYLWWLTIHVITLWTLPCHIVQWLDKHPRLPLSKEMLAWSKPIPQDQWAKPSAELLEQTQTMQQYYANGGKFKDIMTKANTIS